MRNGYEIRTDILSMAKDQVHFEYKSKFTAWELHSRRDEKTGMLTSQLEMPNFPSTEKILETAEKMYAFVNASTKK